MKMKRQQKTKTKTKTKRKNIKYKRQHNKRFTKKARTHKKANYRKRSSNIKKIMKLHNNDRINVFDATKPRSVVFKEISLPKDFIDDISLVNEHMNKYNFYMEKIISSDSWTNNEELS